MRDHYKLSFPLPLAAAARSRVLARLTSLAKIGELARRLRIRRSTLLQYPASRGPSSREEDLARKIEGPLLAGYYSNEQNSKLEFILGALRTYSLQMSYD